jgi:hypothetical protein
MNISGHRERADKEWSELQLNICAAAFIVFLIFLLGLYDWFDRGDAIKYAARHEAVRAAMDARTFCPAPINKEVMHMRADATKASGYDCVTYDNVGYMRAPYKVSKQ